MIQTKTVSASEVKNNFGTLVSQVRSGAFSEVIVENHGEPIVAIVSMAELHIVRAFRERERQKKALALLRKARTQVQASIKGTLTDKTADNLANRFSREFVTDLAKEGRVRFERKDESTL